MQYTALVGIAKSRGKFSHYKVLRYRVVHKWTEYGSFCNDCILEILYVFFTLKFALVIFFYLLVLHLVTSECGQCGGFKTVGPCLLRVLWVRLWVLSLLLLVWYLVLITVFMDFARQGFKALGAN